jgi:hypothetical protein
MIPQIFPAWVVPRPLGSMVPASYLFEVPGSHDPGRDGQRRANNQAEDAKNENKCAAMWFHN